MPRLAREFLTRRYRPMSELYRTDDTYLFKVRDRQLDQVLALKLRLVEEDDVRRARFEREVRLAKSIRHPNVAKVHHLEAGPGFALYTMEFAEGVTLRQRLDQGTVPVQTSLRLFSQVAAGLAAVHAAGVVHRDLRPDSVAITHEGRAVLFDFGLMREEGHAMSIHPPGAWTGLPLYTAPEQDSGKPADHRSDLFSFGAILYEALVGSPLFQAPTEVAVYIKKTRWPPPPASEARQGVPPAVSELLAELVHPDPAHRPATMQPVLSRLHAAQGPS